MTEGQNTFFQNEDRPSPILEEKSVQEIKGVVRGDIERHLVTTATQKNVAFTEPDNNQERIRHCDKEPQMQKVFLTNPTSILTKKASKQVENSAKIPFMSLDRMNANQWIYPSQPVVKPHREVY